jgi:DNA-directed RNA polymerase specialized sigma24 family protein
VPVDSSPPAAFAPTRWSLVLQARGDGEAAHAALEELCTAYWYPLYAWARRSGLNPADSEDAVQSFFAAVLSRRLFERADAERGRLRTFMLTVFRRHLHDEQAKANAERRGGGRVVSFDAAEAEQWLGEEPAVEETSEHYFDRQWALTVLDRALAAVEAAYARRAKQAEFDALRPYLTASGTQAGYDLAGRSVGLGPGAFKVALHRLRDRFREALRAEVRETQPDDRTVDEEMTYLLRILER